MYARATEQGCKLLQASVMGWGGWGFDLIREIRGSYLEEVPYEPRSKRRKSLTTAKVGTEDIAGRGDGV